MFLCVGFFLFSREQFLLTALPPFGCDVDTTPFIGSAQEVELFIPQGGQKMNLATGQHCISFQFQKMDQQQKFKLFIAGESHFHFAETICEEMAESAKARGTGIAKRTPEYIQEKMKEGKAVIALSEKGEWAGFCYIETWSHGEYVANSGLIVSSKFRKGGLARQIKKKIFELSRQKYPNSKIFGLTTGLAVMKINSELGYEPVTYSELTQDEAFWAGCKSCVNYEILMSKGRKNCMCTAMLFDPQDHYEPAETKEFFEKKSKVLERLSSFKQWKFLQPFLKKESGGGPVKSFLHYFFQL